MSVEALDRGESDSYLIVLLASLMHTQGIFLPCNMQADVINEGFSVYHIPQYLAINEGLTLTKFVQTIISKKYNTQWHRHEKLSSQ